MNLPSQEAIDFASEKVQLGEHGTITIDGLPFFRVDSGYLRSDTTSKAVQDGMALALARFLDEYLDTVLDECDCELEADMAIDADGEPFDLNRCHNPNCPCCVPPVYEVGCDCGDGKDVTVISWMKVEPRTYSILPRLLREVRGKTPKTGELSQKHFDLIYQAVSMLNEGEITPVEFDALKNKIFSLADTDF